MAIEPLGNIMSVQAQPIQRVEPVKPAETGTESVVQETSTPVDQSTLTVSASTSKGDGTDENGAKEQGQPSPEQLKQAADRINKSMHNSELLFGIHEATKRITLKVVDRNTKEVIKELPPEKSLDMIAKVWELAGILVDEKR